MPVLELLHTRTFDADMDRLRQFCFPGNYPNGSSKDEFDDESIHIVARADGKLAGAGRLIPRPTAYFRNRFDGQVQIPDEPDVIYFGRLMVAPEHRGHDLFELLMADGLLYACDAGFRLVFGGMEPQRKFRTYIEELGFADFGSLQAFTTEKTVVVQPVVAETRNRRVEWSNRKCGAVSRLSDKGYQIIDHGCPIEPAGGGDAP